MPPKTPPSNIRLDRQRLTIQGIIRDPRVGSQRALGAMLGVSQAAVSKWERRGYLPLDRAGEIEGLLGIPRRHIADPRIVDALESVESLMQAV
jgi:predicted transcriptional regulator